MASRPSTRRRAVRRERLLAVLGEWRTYRLLRVVAPAGFGKSTLGAQWFQQLASLPQSERPARAWVALEQTDDAPERLLRRLVDALQTDFPDAPALLARALAAEQSFSRVLGDLLVLLGAHPAPIVLLFDDLHRLHEPATLALLQAILDDGPPNLHLALFTRTRPPLRASRLQLEQRVLHLGVHDLNFDHDEFTALVADAALADDQLAHLERRAGGWAAGLQMLLQVLDQGSSVSLIGDAAAVADDFWEYIEQEVLQNLPPHEIDFLIDVSLLPHLTHDLCATVTGLPPAECEQLLRRIVAANSLVTAPVGSDFASGGSIHAVLRRFLLRRLPTRHATDALRTMRRRAALHLADAGEVDAALDLLLPTPTPKPKPTDEPSLHWLGDDPDAAADLVERAGHAALQQGELVAVRRWMRKLPDAVIRTRPRLAVDNAWASVHLIETGSDRYLQRVYDSLRTSPQRADDALRAEVVAMEAIRRMIDGRYPDAWDALQRARAMPIPPNSLAAAYLDSCSGYLMYGARRSLDERVHDMQRGEELFARIGFLRGRVETLCMEASLRRIYADSAGTVASAARARQLMDETGFDATAFRILLNREVGDALYAMNLIDPARAEYRALQTLVDQQNPAAETAYTARVRLHLCDLAEGVAPIIDDDADEREWDALRSRGYGLTVHNTAYRRIQRDMLRSRPDLCWRTVTSLGILPPSLTAGTPLALTLAVLAGAVFTGRHLDEVGPQLVDFRARMDAIEHRFFKYHAHALLVQLYAQQCNPKAAALELRSLLADLEPGGFTRIILDLPAAHPLLRDVDTPFAARLVAIIDALRTAPIAISPAEHRVLTQLATDGSTTQIAERLFLSVDTVRTHIKSIYAKLDVHDRARALERAREMGIL